MGSASGMCRCRSLRLCEQSAGRCLGGCERTEGKRDECAQDYGNKVRSLRGKSAQISVLCVKTLMLPGRVLHVHLYGPWLRRTSRSFLCKVIIIAEECWGAKIQASGCGGLPWCWRGVIVPKTKKRTGGNGGGRMGDPLSAQAVLM